jgi:hypothetical protein
MDKVIDAVEDLYLMGRFHAALAAAKVALSSSSSFSSQGLNRILSILIQASIKCKKTEELGEVLEYMPTLPPTLFLLRQLALIEDGKTEEARGRIEARMALSMDDEEVRAALSKCLALTFVHKTKPAADPNQFITMTGFFNDIDSSQHIQHSASQEENSSRPSAFHQVRQFVTTGQWLPISLSSQRQLLISLASALFLFSLVAERKALTAALKLWWRQIRTFFLAFHKRLSQSVR